MIPNSTTIRENVEAWLEFLEITVGPGGVQIFDDHLPDRVFAWDLKRELLIAVNRNTDHWMRDQWDPLHGKSTRQSFREKAEPSMQVCIHACINETNGEPYFVEIDFDKAAPYNPKTIVIHGVEVLVNKASGGFTDQNEIADGLARRREKETAAA